MDAWGEHIQAALSEQMGQSELKAPLDVPDLDLDPELKAHFTRAYEILEQIGRKTPPTAVSDQTRNAPCFSLMIDARGELIAASETARDLLSGQDPLEALRDELVVPSDELLNQLMRSAQVGDEDAPPVVLTTACQPRHLLARIVPVYPGSAPTLLTLVIEALEYQWSDSAEAMLVTSFSLSRAEVDVVRKLLAGLSLRQIAEQSGRSEHTVRNQAKAVLAKTGAPGQVDLIRLVVFLINQDRANSARGGSTIALPRHIMQMQSNGHAMQVYRMGSSSARPVIYFHGMLDGPAAIQYFRKRFVAQDMQVIIPARPGYGQSSPVERAEHAIDRLEENIRELIEREGFEKPLFLSHLGGSLYAHSIAARLGAKVGGVVAVSGNAPITRLSQLSHMAARQRIVAYTARFAPALLPTVLRAGIAQVDGQEVTEFLAALFKPGTHDFALIERLNLAANFHAGFRFSVEQGHIGFATDSHHVVRDWGKTLGVMQAPVIYLNGEHDPVVPPDTVVAAMAGRKNVDVRVLPNVAQLLFYERPDTVFNALEEVFAHRNAIAA